MGFQKGESLGDTLDKIGWGPFHVTMLVLSGTIYMVDAMQLLLASAISGPLSAEFQMSTSSKVFLTSSVFVGQMIGSLVSGPVGDKHGRRFVMIGAHCIMTLFGVVSAYANNVAVMLLSRFLIGVACGSGIPATVTILVEMSPTSVRSHLNNIQGGVFFPLGEVWASLGLAMFMPTMVEHEWRNVVLWCTLPAVLAMPLVLFFVDESPRWLLKDGRHQELERVMTHIATMNGKPDIVAGMRWTDHEAQVASANTEKQSATQLIGMLFSSNLRSTTMICSFCFMVCFVVFYGESYFLSQAFAERGDDGMAPAWQMVITSAFGLPAILVSMALIEAQWLGHKGSITLLMCLNALFATALMSFDFDMHWVSNVASYGLKLFSSAMINMTFIYIPEAYPVAVRQTALGFCSCAGRVGAILAPLMFESSMENFNGSHIPYLASNVVICLVGALLARNLSVETKFAQLADTGIGETRPLTK